ncbi:MAG: PhzF family phenazine biosynthesis protein [Rhodospirillaceae bacterium]
MLRPYKVVDVFSAAPLRGNPLAVVLDASGLSTADMQAIAGWTNLSETTFFLPPTNPSASYKVRIFTPRNELPFAGHPTLGSAFAFVEAGKVTPHNGKLVQECAVGLVHLTVDGAKIALEMPRAKIAPLPAEDADELEGLLARKIVRAPAPALVDVGPVWIIAQLATAADVLALKPDLGRLEKLERKHRATGLTVFGPYASGDVAIEVRTFAPSAGILEDPVCGSGNGSVAAFQFAASPSPNGMRYTAAQGRCVGREGRIAIDIDAGGKIMLGGACVTTVDGTLSY